MKAKQNQTTKDKTKQNQELLPANPQRCLSSLWCVKEVLNQRESPIGGTLGLNGA